jgi:broad specificity phosphatase PhoE
VETRVFRGHAGPVAVRLAACLLLLGGRAAIAQERTTVILVRHAERESLSTPDPQLTAAGRLRAQALLAVARDAGVQAIITTQFVRTETTAEPLAAALGIAPEIIPDTGARHASDVADAILKKHAGQTVLVVGHGHTVPAIMRALGATTPAPKLCESRYDLLYVISVAPSTPARVLRTHYGAAPPADSTCPPGEDLP